MRTTNGAARAKAKKRMLKKAKGFRGGRGNMSRTVQETLIRAGVFAFRARALILSIVSCVIKAGSFHSMPGV